MSHPPQGNRWFPKAFWFLSILLSGVLASGSSPGIAAPADQPAAESTRGGILGVAVATPAEGHKGVRIVSLLPDSPAAKAGLVVGDRIVSVDRKEIASPDDLVGMIRDKAPGTKLDIRFFHDGQEKTVTAALASRELADEQVRPRRPRIRAMDDQAQLGLMLEPSGDNTVRVVRVHPQGPAAQAGVVRGDILVRVGDHAIAKVEDAQRVVAAMKPHDKVDLLVRRDGKDVTLHAILASGREMHETMMREMEDRLQGNPQCCEGLERLRKDHDDLRKEVQDLRKQVEELQRPRPTK